MVRTSLLRAAASSGWKSAFKKWNFNSAGYNQYGLLHDDIIHESPEVKEALRRLSKKTLEERQFRMSRALYLSMRKEILPENEWTTFEQDVRYLEPVVEEVQKEFAEKQEWNSK